MPCVVWSHMVEFRVRVLSWLVGCVTWQINTCLCINIRVRIKVRVSYKP
jgi:hypothetical protein